MPEAETLTADVLPFVMEIRDLLIGVVFVVSLRFGFEVWRHMHRGRDVL